MSGYFPDAESKKELQLKAALRLFSDAGIAWTFDPAMDPTKVGGKWLVPAQVPFERQPNRRLG